MPHYPDRHAHALQLRVAPSQSKHKLYVGNIPKELTTDTLKQELSSAVKGETHSARPWTSYYYPVLWNNTKTWRWRGRVRCCLSLAIL